ncbi:hypothetical protein ACP70R_033440 [Stipagrostis hirtigluma subsp. patula]
MRAAVSLVAGAASLAVGYGQLWSRPDDLALACAAVAATFLLVHYAAVAVDASSSSPSSGGDDGDGDAERTHGKRMALAMALLLYGLACAEVWDAAASREVAVAALASWCGAAALLLVYLVVTSAGCHRGVGTDVHYLAV